MKGYAHGETLPSFHRESVTWKTYHRVCEVLELEQLNDLLDVGVLLLLGDVEGLSKVGRDSEGFSDGLSVLVDIGLLDVGGSSLEVDSRFSSVDESLRRE